MSYRFPPDIDALVQHQLAAGNFANEDDVLRAALVQLAGEGEGDLEAIQKSIADFADGDPGRPAGEVFAELRARYNIPEAPCRS
jgi:Arc/MetJ-type ribon-helix-helix transcriptional regulator